MSKPSAILNRFLNQYRLLRLVEILLFAVSTGLIVYSLSNYFLNQLSAIGLGSLSGIGIGLFLVQHYEFLKLDVKRIADYLNQQYPKLQNSIDLLLAPPASLSALQNIQKQKIENEIVGIATEFKLPNRLLQAVGGFVLTVLILYLLPSTSAIQRLEEPQPSSIIESKAHLKNEFKLSITVNPPQYTRISETVTSSPSIKIIEGSAVLWELNFSEEVQNVRLVLSAVDTFKSNQTDNKTISFKQVIEKSGFYQLQWQWNDSTYFTDYASIEVTPDHAPEIKIVGIKQFTELKLSDDLNVNLQTQLKDDFGLTHAQIIATVSKGSGESVKFREEKFNFSKPTTIAGKSLTAHRNIDLKQLGLESGDELYFYVEAFDNKIPTTNRSRTETFFIALQDTSTQVAVDDEGLGVDLMPEYFRSQRQIIIDSEKLLAERNKISKSDFNSRSNELGYDQKVLRLRYGQFLGEEFETAIGPTQTETEEEVNADEDLTKAFGHQHDTENEHNLVDQSKPNDKNKNTLEEFAHNHDNSEEATFFIQSVKAKLRAALTLMWDAELHLRMFDPEKSLPYQYKILKLLKEISNDSRIYVHRTGFDPPPIKEDKRLMGDLSELKNNSVSRSLVKQDQQIDLKKAITLLSSRDNLNFTLEEQRIMGTAGKDVAKAALEKPGQYLEALSALKNLSEGKSIDPKKSEKLIHQLISLLKDVNGTPSANQKNNHAWDELLVKKLNTEVKR